MSKWCWLACWVSVILAVGCNTGELGQPWEVTLAPDLICQGESTQLRWDLGRDNRCWSMDFPSTFDGDCLAPAWVEVRSAPAVPPPVLPTRLAPQGALSFRPEHDTALHLQALNWNQEWATYTRTVRVVPRGRSRTLVGTFRGQCDSAVPTWQALQLADVNTPSSGVYLHGLCNPNPFGLRLIIGPERGDTKTLWPNACLELDGVERASLYAIPLSMHFTWAARCRPDEFEPPPDIQVEAVMACR